MNTFEIILITISAYFLVQWAIIGTLSWNSFKGIPKKILKQYAYPRHTFHIIIPAYKYTDVLLKSLFRLYQQRYPSAHFQVTVVGQHLENLDLSTRKEIVRYSDNFLELNSDESSKTKAIHFALDNIDIKEDYVLVLDIDNLLPIYALEDTNALIHTFNETQRKYAAIQWSRIAYPQKSEYGVYDAFTESFNNHVFRKGSQRIGLPAALSGSGMVFPRQLFCTVFESIHGNGGFDKQLEIKWTQNKGKIHYTEEIAIYDEKVQAEAVYNNQRSRWFAAQVKYFFQYATQIKSYRSFATLFKLWQFQLPPRVILFILPFVLLFVNSITGFFLLNPAVTEAIVIMNLATIAGIGFSIIMSYPSATKLSLLVKNVWQILPKLVKANVQNLFKVQKSNSSFYQTPHHVVSE